MKYRVTFENGQISVYDTKTPFDEFKNQFTLAKKVENLEEAVIPVAEEKPAAPEVEKHKAKTKKAG